MTNQDSHNGERKRTEAVEYLLFNVINKCYAAIKRQNKIKMESGQRCALLIHMQTAAYSFLANTRNFRKSTWTIRGYQLRNLQNAASMSPLLISFIHKENELTKSTSYSD